MSDNRIPIEFEGRFWFPNRDGRTDEWSWQRHREVVYMQLPTGSAGWRYSMQLPPPMFSYSAASYVHFELCRTDRGGGLFAGLQIDGYRMFSGIPFSESKLWTQITFQVPWYGANHSIKHDMWWLRWRCPQAEHDIMSLVRNTMEDINKNAEHPEVVKDLTQRLNREIVMNALGGTLPDRIVRFKHD